MFDDDPGMEMEAIEQERFDADLLQAQYERESNDHWRRLRKALNLKEQGKLDEAAALCTHEGGYPLDSLAAEHSYDPRKGETGWRCGDCLSVVTGMHGDVIHPCEPQWEV